MRWSLYLFLFSVLLSSFAMGPIGCDGVVPPADGGIPDGGVVKDGEPTDDPPTPTCGKTEVVFTATENKKIFGLSPLPAVPANPSNKYADDPKAAHLGQYLFYDKRLGNSGDTAGTVACSTCHSPSNSWSDLRMLSKGLDTLGRHSPVLWNVVYNRWFFWDGRADSIWSQALKPIEDAKEMGGNRFRVLYLFAKEAPALKQAYEAIFGPLPGDLVDTYKFKDAMPMPDDTANEVHKNWESLSTEDQEKVNRFFSNIGKAIEAFERKIISKDAPFDSFVASYKKCDAEGMKALSASAQRGLKIFIKKDSCITCHDGPNFSDGEFHNIGLPKLGDAPQDIGRFGVLKKFVDNIFLGTGPFSDAKKDDPFNDKINFLRTDNPNSVGEFKTPTLRHVEKSGPYMHDGRFAELKDVVKFYSHFGVEDATGCIQDARAVFAPPKKDPNAKVQDPEKCKLSRPHVGLREETMILLLLKDDEIEDVVNFLKSLTGKSLPDELLSQPQNPALK